MKKIRYLPFGYTIRNGQTVIDQQEAETVRGIFTAYIHGASLKEIAEDLKEKHPIHRAKLRLGQGENLSDTRKRQIHRRC